MPEQKTKAIRRMEEKMQEIDPASFRYEVLKCAKNFKGAWIALGQHLYTVYKDKLYKDWDYLTFEAYCSKEIGVRQSTAMKLLKSYYFLEKERPDFVRKQAVDGKKPTQIPNYESVNALRLAKENSRIPQREYNDLYEDVLDHFKGEGDVKKKIRYVLKSTAPSFSPKELAGRKAQTAAKLVISLKNMKNTLQEHGFPSKVLKQVDSLIDLLADYQR